MSSNSLYIGIDGGGTKTEVLCGDSAGAILGSGISGPSNLHSVPEAVACSNLSVALEQATKGLDVTTSTIYIYLGLAGVDTPAEVEQAKHVFTSCFRHMPTVQLEVVNDSLIALASGSDNPNALILISGTGSNCIGYNQRGESAKTSGMDFLLTDQGSGYDIGRKVLREAVKSYDGRSPQSLLERLVCEYFKITSVADLKAKVYHPLLSKQQIAELSIVCAQAFEAGDTSARLIMEHARDELVLQVSTVVTRLSLQEGPFDCVCTGSVSKVPYIKAELQRILTARYPTMTILFPKVTPVHGALKKAQHMERIVKSRSS